MNQEQKCKDAIDKAIRKGTGMTVNGNPVFDYKQCENVATFKKVFNEHFADKYTYSNSEVGIVKTVLTGTGLMLKGIGEILIASSSGVNGVVINKK